MIILSYLQHFEYGETAKNFLLKRYHMMELETRKPCMTWLAGLSFVRSIRDFHSSFSYQPYSIQS